MTMLKLTTAVESRFRTTHSNGRPKLDFVREVPCMEERIELLQQTLLSVAYDGIVLEYTFWMKELKRRQTLSPHALTVMARRLRLLNADLPRRLRDPNLEIILKVRLKRHMRLNARDLIYQMRAVTEPGKLPGMRRQLRSFLRRGGLSLEDVGCSTQQLNEIRRRCDEAWSRKRDAERAEARAARALRQQPLS